MKLHKSIRAGVELLLAPLREEIASLRLAIEAQGGSVGSPVEEPAADTPAKDDLLDENPST